MLRQLDQYSTGSRRMKERDPLSLRSDSWFLINQAEPGFATPLESAIQVVDSETDVVDTRSALFEELSNR